MVGVLAHADWGAMTATLSGHRALPGQVGSLTLAIQPALDLAGDQPDDMVNRVLRVNTDLVAERLRSAKPVLSDVVQAGRLRVAGAYYRLSNGCVEILSR